MHFQRNVVTTAAHSHSQRISWSFLCSDVTSALGANGILPPPLTYAPRLRSDSPWVPRLAHRAKCRSAYVDVSEPYAHWHP